MASITFKRGTKAELENTEIQDGQLLMETDQLNNNKIYLDLADGTRVPVGGSGAWVGTQAEYEVAVEEGQIADGTQVIITDDYTFGEITANMVLYSNANSNLTSTNVQGALDEVARGGKELTKVEYDRMEEAKKMNGTSYFIYDYDALSPQMVDLPKATYDALPAEEKTDGTTYFVYDENAETNAENISYQGDISATNVKGALDTLNSTLTWRKLTSVEGVNEITLPSIFSEVEIKVVNGSDCIISRISKEAIPSVSAQFIQEGRYANTSSYISCQIKVLGNKVKLENYFKNGNDLTSSSVTTVYVR